MANFDTSATKHLAVHDANSIMPSIYSAYTQLKLIQALLARYVAGTDAPFIAAVNALFNASERVELNAMLVAIGPLVLDWETNHANALVG